MIKVSRFNGTSFVINCEWIETVEATPDTVITLVNGKKYVVNESVDDIINMVIEYKRRAGFIHRLINPLQENDDK
ncbi:MAG: flagellar FlbD family protein [Clostridiaceae bacterium]|nr:flagellar FlbD family protein [Clostridiaceae bacterium]